VSESTDPPPPPLVGAGEGFGGPALLGAMIFTCAEPERAGSAADTAVTVTVAGEGTRDGAE
jgi:hypothetical protein